MLAYYITAASIGLGLVILTLFSDHDHGGDDVDTNHETNIGEGAGLWIPFLSLRFWTFGLLTSGLIGLILTYMGRKEPTVASISIPVGAGMGLLVSYLIRQARLSEISSSADAQDLQGVHGRILSALRPGQPGKVRCQVKGETIDMVAVSYDNEPIDLGEDVYVMLIENGAAVVARSENLLSSSEE